MIYQNLPFHIFWIFFFLLIGWFMFNYHIYRYRFINKYLEKIAEQLISDTYGWSSVPSTIRTSKLPINMNSIAKHVGLSDRANDAHERYILARKIAAHVLDKNIADDDADTHYLALAMLMPEQSMRSWAYQFDTTELTSVFDVTLLHWAQRAEFVGTLPCYNHHYRNQSCSRYHNRSTLYF